MRILFAIALGLLLHAPHLGAQTPPPASTPLYARSWALVVGVDRYAKFRPQLNYAVADAQAIAEILPRLGFPPENIRTLFDHDATKTRIEAALQSGFPGMAREDRLLVFFAGHGITAPVKDGEEGYLVPFDAEPDRIEWTGIAMDELVRIGRRVKANHVLFILDACFSGFAISRSGGGRALSDDYLAAVLKEPAVQVITAGRKGQEAIETGGHGLFTRRVLDGLRGFADTDGRGYITAAHLASWVEERVARDSKGKMTPQFGKLVGEGQFVFDVRSGAGDKTRETLQVAAQILHMAGAIPEPFFRALGYSATAAAQRKAGDARAALASLNKAFDALAGPGVVVPRSVGRTWRSVPELKGELHIEQAKVSVGLRDGSDAGPSFAEARRIALRLPEEAARADLLRQIVEAQVELGDFRGALQTTLALPAVRASDRDVYPVAVQAARKGKIADAVHIALQAASSAQRWTALEEVAYQYALADHAAARHVAVAAADGFTRTALLLGIARARADNKVTAEVLLLLDEAATAARTISVPDDLALAAAAVIERQRHHTVEGAAQTVGEATRMVRAIPDPDTRARAAEQLAGAHAELGDLAEALRDVHALPNSVAKVRALAWLGARQAKLGDAAGSRATLEAVRRIAPSVLHQVPSDFERHLVAAHVEAGDVAGALVVAHWFSRIPKHAYASVIGALVGRGRGADAVRLADAIGDPESHAWLIAEIAQRLQRAGDPAGAAAARHRAASLLAPLPASIDKASALIDLSRQFGSVGDAATAGTVLDAATEAARRLTTPEARGHWLARIITVQYELGLSAAAAATHQHLVAVTSAVTDPRTRAKTLYVVGAAHAKAREKPLAFDAFQRAADTARLITGDPMRGPLLIDVARQQSQLGDVAAALQTAGSLSDEWEKGQALYLIALEQGRAGDSKGPLAWAAVQTSSLARISLLTGLLDGLSGERDTR